MDTIIYFYKQRDLKELTLAVIKAEDYRLIKVGLCGGDKSWFGRALPTLEQVMEEEEDETDSFLPLRLLKKWFPALMGRRQRRERQQQRNRQQERYEQELADLEDEIRELIRSIQRRMETLDDCACVYADGSRAFLSGDGVLAKMWKGNWNIPEFMDYRKYRWARFLLPYAENACFVLLGVAADIPEAVKALARGMKSLRWIVRESDCDENIRDFLEDFYEDYGLAIDLQTVAGRNGFRTLCLESVKPVCVLDFTEETKFFWGGLASGSVWLDFSSLEEKEKRMERLTSGISYFSMKKLWRNS